LGCPLGLVAAYPQLKGHRPLNPKETIARCALGSTAEANQSECDIAVHYGFDIIIKSRPDTAYQEWCKI
jgi:hypothetical protein